MKKLNFLILSALILLSSIGFSADDQVLTSLEVTPGVVGFDNVSFTGKSEKKTSSIVAALRKKRSQTQFERTMKKHYPDGYKVLVSLNAEDRSAVYERYRRGDKMASVRVAVFEMAALYGY